MPRSRRSRALFALIVGALLLPALYVLSIGPVAASYGWQNDPAANRRFETGYAPLLFCVRMCPALGRPVNEYIKAFDLDGCRLIIDAETGTVRSFPDRYRL